MGVQVVIDAGLGARLCTRGRGSTKPTLFPPRPSIPRAIGDLDLRQDGLIPDADKLEVDLRPQDDFVILASDGLWDVMTNQEAVCLVQDTVKHPTMCAQVSKAMFWWKGRGYMCRQAVVRCTRWTASLYTPSTACPYLPGTWWVPCLSSAKPGM